MNGGTRIVQRTTIRSRAAEIGYIYSSFTRTVKLWWDPWMGSDGAVYSSIDGGASHFMGEVLNASRVIRYVVTFGYRYQSYSLVDMRIHDINVVADLSRHDPNAPSPDEPVEQDGTGEGAVEGLRPTPEGIALLDAMLAVMAHLQTWWEGWWPVLHLAVSFATTMGGTATLHCSVDLLMSFQVVELRIDTPVDDGMTQAQSQQYSSKVLHSLQEESTGSGWAQFIQGLTFFVLTVFAAISFLMSLPVSTATMYGLFAALIVTWGAWVDVLLLGLYAQVISWEFVLGLLSYWLEIVTGVCIETTAMLVLAAGICRMFISEKWGEFKAAVKWAVISIALNLVLALATFYLFVFIYERSVDQFRRQQ